MRLHSSRLAPAPICTPIALALLAACAAVLAGPRLGAQGVLIHELHYEPPDRTRHEEFIELFNCGPDAADLSGAFFSSGVEFTFPPGSTLAPGAYAVIAEDPADFEARFGFAPDYGPFLGRLANEGERAALRWPDGSLIDEVDYQAAFPWPLASAGRGSSMELIHPSLDNDLGGSWRASGFTITEPVPPVYFLPARSSGWSYRKGTSEASDPPDAWRRIDFVEDATWLRGTASIGYGDGDDATNLADMQGSYSSVYLRHVFRVEDPGEVPDGVKLQVYVDDGAVVWINGVEVARLFVPGGELAHDSLAQNHEASWSEVALPDPAGLLVPGDNVVAVHAVNQALTSSDFSIDATVFVPGSDPVAFGEPTPRAPNSILSENAPPQVRQVEHIPRQPASGAPFAVACKVTDPDGVAEVTLLYQVVAPGDYIPAYLPLPHGVLLSDPSRPRDRNPAFDDPASWTAVPMFDDGGEIDALAGDDVYSAAVPAQENRTLVRYRIRVTDTSGERITVPYPDDRSLNFAAFVYDGVPPYVAATRTVQPGGPPYTYSEEVMRSLPVYFLITRSEDLAHCIAYDGSLQIPKSNEGARDKFNWEGCFVYDGFVYDHIRYRLRQANDRYGGSGKRSMRFRFNKGNRFRARDRFGERYPTLWRTINTGKMFDNKRVGNFGLTEELNNLLWNMVGVPSPFVHTFHFRVLDGADEAPAGVNGQHLGDFWGMFLAFEDYDASFLQAHDLEDGNLYKLKDGIFDGNRVKRHQGRFAVTSDADFQNIRNNLRPERDDSWLEAHVHYDLWYYYHAIVEGVRHYDFVPADSHLKNRAWYFEPSDTNPLGRLWTLPHDSDASWGPNWNSGVDYSKNAIFANGGKPAFKQEYRNAIREVRDLLWTRETIFRMVDDLAGERREMAKADRDRWRGAPPEAGSQDFGSMETKVQDMKNFAFTGWSGSTGPTVGPGGRAAYLDSLAAAEGDATSIPDTPEVTYAGPPGFPADALAFRSTPFSDPQGAGTFRAIEWRAAEVTDPAAPGFDPQAALRYEWDAVWTSGELNAPTPEITVPPVLAIGRTYRVRARMLDRTNKWSHWSEPIELTVSAPEEPLPQQSYLRVTELMYHPPEGEEFEFVELQNTGPVALDLSFVSFTSGIEFSFAAGEIRSLAPGEFVVVVANRAAFEALYDTTAMRIAGEYSRQLSNAGEAIRLTLGETLLVQEFAFDDEWHLLADGFGHSLEVSDPAAPPEAWSFASGWQASEEPGGTPGQAGSGVMPSGGYRLPADANGDGVLDISDAVSLVRKLFVAAAALPCDGASAAEGGNAVLLDANGDGRVDISDPIHVLDYLYRQGPAPAQGTRCVRIEGCSTVCVP